MPGTVAGMRLGWPGCGWVCGWAVGYGDRRCGAACRDDLAGDPWLGRLVPLAGAYRPVEQVTQMTSAARPSCSRRAAAVGLPSSAMARLAAFPQLTGRFSGGGRCWVRTSVG